MSQDTESAEQVAARRRRRFRRRLGIAVFLLFAIPIALAVALPTLLSTGPGRGLVLSIADKMVAPTRVSASDLKLSWFGPTRFRNLKLIDAAGKVVVDAPTASLDRSVWQLLFSRPDYGTLTLQKPIVDIKRYEDGSIDLYDALTPILNPDPTSTEPSDPNLAFTLIAQGGTLTVNSPELAEPITAERLELTLKVPPAPDPTSWSIALSNPSKGDESLAIEGRYDHRAAEGTVADLASTISGTRWPLVLTPMEGYEGSARLDGGLSVERKMGLWSSTGDARLLDLDAAGPALADDRLRLDRLAAVWDVADEGEKWSVRKLSVDSALATLQGSGEASGRDDATARIAGRVDLAGLANRLPHAFRLREGLVLERGEATLKAELTTSETSQKLDAEAKVSELLARLDGRAVGLPEPAEVRVVAVRNESGLQVETLSARTAFLDLNGSGSLASAIQLNGTLDLGLLQQRLGQLLDFGQLVLAGRARVEASYHREDDGYTADATADVADLSIEGATAQSIQTERAKLQADARGPAALNGIPTGLATANLLIQSRELAAQLIAEPEGDAVAVRASLATNLLLADRTEQIEARASGSWPGGRRFDFEELIAGLRKIGTPADQALMAIAARGSLDLDAGTLQLAALPRTVGPTGAPAIEPLDEGLKISGLNRPGEPLSVEGRVAADLTALDRIQMAWRGGEPLGYSGVVAAGVAARREPAGPIVFGVNLASDDLTMYSVPGPGMPPTPRVLGPATLAAKGQYDPSPDALALDTLTVRSRYGTLDAAGTIAELTGRRVADLNGKLAPDWAKLDDYLAQTFEPGAMIRAQARPFRLRGALSGDSLAETLRGLDAEAGLDIEAAAAYGLKLGPAPLVFHAQKGQITIDPIDTTLNEGRVVLKPDLALGDDGSVTLSLAPGSGVAGVQINEEVSTKLLSYVAPVLHEATQVRGVMSVAFDKTEIPISGPDDRKASVDGRIAFGDVTYGPGPLMRELLSVAGVTQLPNLRLDQTIPFRVADGRVIQRGLKVDVTPQLAIEMDGDVGFDKTIALKAAVPLNAGLLGNQGIVNEVVDGMKVGVPIGGTLSHPQIDRQALAAGVRDSSRQLIRRGAATGVRELLRDLDVPGLPTAGTAATSAAGAAAGTALPAASTPAQAGSTGSRIARDALRLLLPPDGNSTGGATLPR